MPRTFRWIVAAAVLGNAAIFLLTNTPISAQDIARLDRGIDEKAAYIHGHFAPATTSVVTVYDKMLVDQYLAGAYPLIAYDPAVNPRFERSLRCLRQDPCEGAELDVVLWDDLLRAEGGGWQEVRMPHGGRLRVAHALRSATLRANEGLGISIVP